MLVSVMAQDRIQLALPKDLLQMLRQRAEQNHYESVQALIREILREGLKDEQI